MNHIEEIETILEEYMENVYGREWIKAVNMRAKIMSILAEQEQGYFERKLAIEE